MQKHGREDLCKRGFEERLLRSHSSLFFRDSVTQTETETLQKSKQPLFLTGIWCLCGKISLKLLLDTERGENVLLE